MIVIQRSCIFGLLDEKKDGEEKGGKHFVKENIWKANEMRNGKKGEIFGEGRNIFAEEKKNGEGK